MQNHKAVICGQDATHLYYHFCYDNITVTQEK